MQKSSSRSINRQALGSQAEDAAADFLQRAQCQIIARNLRCRRGEIDIVARDAAGTVIVAEVRMRSRRDFGGGAATVGRQKQRRLILSSQLLLQQQPQLARSPIRFDVLELAPEQSGYSVNWIRHAFSL